MAMSEEQKLAKQAADRAAIKTRDLPCNVKDFSYLLAVALVGAPTESASKNPEALIVAPVGAAALVGVKTEVVIHGYCGAADLQNVKYFIGRIYSSKLSGVKHIAPEAVIVPSSLTAGATARRATGATRKVNTPTVYRDFEAAAKAVEAAPSMLAYVTYARVHKTCVDWSLAEYDRVTGADPTVAPLVKRYGTLAPTGAAAVALAAEIEAARAAVALVNDSARGAIIIYSKTRAVWHRVLHSMSEASIQVCSTMPQTAFRAAREAAAAAPVAPVTPTASAPTASKTSKTSKTDASSSTPTAPTGASADQIRQRARDPQTTAAARDVLNRAAASADRRARKLATDNSAAAMQARKTAAAARDQRASDAAAAAVAPVAPTSASKTSAPTASAPTSDQTAPTSAAA